ncbi:T9SS type A sorting domain-containing protein [Cytophaga hutchinsonii]|uniref:Copper binding protein, plastocyanin n=1 Tax=Cytophaga hutchinsonii (strain ATCC 33406 / DSM 1761 / CIP 103989 / NBRC 15051 / NCIMB 9469 / D465) TaxID=269798 RepID=A0A6N4SQB9_CYTH3|nr:T9SS type A sorting domain-containing protein [Cytophaga hutchinsonii]ABG58558.1 copper binding protein, plastocyanin [Cytophaga hutchinsonii ATCC 33406]SFX76996.1 Por secretion system C-terminal sorting domain-containing protein [Cytophaga hutchinsonii ATCC 33406]
MKKMYLIFVFMLSALFCQAAAVAVTISGFAFSPAQTTVQVGDVITWTNMDNTLHSIVSTAVPAGAAPFTSGTFGKNETFTYTVTEAGDYTYQCGVHTSMLGAFTATITTPVVKPTLILEALYPNPASASIHIESPKSIKSIDIYSETGVLVKTLAFTSASVDVPIGELNKGAYLLRITSEDGMFDTRRIIKL